MKNFRTRTMIDILKDVSKFIISATQPFFKSSLKEIGLDATTTDVYIRSFEIAQQTPEILVQRLGNNTIVAKK